LVPIVRVVASDEVVEIVAGEALLLQGEVHVRAEVIEPHLFGPRLLAGGLAVEEEDVGLDALGEDGIGACSDR